MIITTTDFDIFSGNDGAVVNYGYRSITGGITLTFLGADQAIVTKPSLSGGMVTDRLYDPGQVIGTRFADTLVGSQSAPAGGSWIALTGGAGDDSINGHGDYWNLADYGTSTAGIGADLAAGRVADGLGGADTLTDVVSLRGSAQADSITGGDGGAWLLLEGMAGDDSIDGKGLLSNGVSYVASPAGITLDLGASTARDGWGGIDTLIQVVRVIGSAHADSIRGGDADDWFQASWGDDSIDGAGGRNTLDYGMIAGPVQVTMTGDGAGGAAKPHGTDSFIHVDAVQGGAAGDTLTGLATTARAVSLRGMAGDDTIDGAGSALNRADYTDSPTGITVDLQTRDDGDAWSGQASDGWGGTDSLLSVRAVHGSAFADSIRGSSRDDVILGGGDDDTIDGGGGHDTALYACSRTDAGVGWARNPDGSWTVTTPDGTDTLRNVEALQFRDGTVNLPAVQDDFTGDGRSEILFDNDTLRWMGASYRAVSQWSVDGTDYLGGDTFGTVEASWSVLGTGDFNGDGRADMLWRHADGHVSIWLMDGRTYLGGDTVATLPGEAAWLVLGTGDLDGDGRADILMGEQGTDAGGAASLTLHLWEMDGLSILRDSPVAAVAGSCSVQGVADFDGDGKADLLWRNADGVASIWLMDGPATLSATAIATVSPDWSIAGTGDFDGDGRADILWRNADGGVAIWLMDGTRFLGGGSLWNPGTSWDVAAVGDYNGDGRSDILWRQQAAGMPHYPLAVWLMDGLTAIGGGTIAQIDGDWRVL